jgi:uncharacterized protein YozE (UPF0346 family)
LTFKNWIAKYEKQGKPIGDLARDISGDKEFPETNDCEKILDYLHHNHACDNAIDTFKSAWRRYISAIFKEWND